MNIYADYIKNSRGMKRAAILLLLFFIIKISAQKIQPATGLILGDLAMLGSMYYAFLFFTSFLEKKNYSSISLILNAGIIGAIVYFFISVFGSQVSYFIENILKGGIFFPVAISIYSLALAASMLYLFSVFRILFFLRQKKDPSYYFYTMLLFFAASSFSASLMQLNGQFFDYLKKSFSVVAIFLITVNSIRTAWIAFLRKKEKYYLLGISIVLCFLFGANASHMYNEVTIKPFSDFSGLYSEIFFLISLYGCIYFVMIFFTTLFHLPTAEAFDRKAEETSSYINLNKLLTQVFDFRELADTVTSTTMNVCNSDAAWLVSSGLAQPVISSSKNIGIQQAGEITKWLVDNCSLETMTGCEAFHLDRNGESKSGFPAEGIIKFAAVAPLKVYDKVNGYLVAVRRSEIAFDEEDKKSVSAFADYAAIAIENSKLLKESIEKERLEKEMDVAREVQRKILPVGTPHLPHMEISALFVPAYEVGGDYYDFFEISEDKIGFVIADVSGKGISAAFIMSEIKGIFESLSKLLTNPANVLVQANEILKKSLDKKTFVTAIYGIIDNKSKNISLARAGHLPVMLLRQSNITYIKPSGLGLGLQHGDLFSGTLEEANIKLENNDTIVLFTDGIPESQNANLEDFGFERLESIVKEFGNKDTETLSREIMKNVTLYSQGNSQHDDLTLVIIKWKEDK